MSELNNGDVTDVLDSFFIDYAIDDDDDEATVKELMKQRSDMNKTVNEWYAKAKAYEKIRQVFKNNPGVKDKKKLWNIYYESFKVVRELESGETNA